MKINLDPWQKEFIKTKGDKILCCGRQVGKSVICGKDAGDYAVNHGNKVILMIAPTERQAYALFEKTLFYLTENFANKIKHGKDRPTKSKINLTNGTRIWCLPTGISGIGIRFLTVHRLYADEAAYIPEEVWTAVTPMLLTTGGDMILLSTPKGRESTFADTFLNKDEAYDSFTRFSQTSEEVVKNRLLCTTWTEFQRDKALQHLARERAKMSALQYAQEYEGALLDELRQFFPTELIKACMTLKRDSLIPEGAKKYLGVDVARMGEDETVLAGLALTTTAQHGTLLQFQLDIFNKFRLTQTVREILKANDTNNYRKIYIDDGGLGGGVFDPLLENPSTKRKVVPINNAARALDCDREAGRKKKLLKEDLYNNLLVLMEQGRIKFLNRDELFHSLKSVQAEYTDGGQLKIFGNYTHITEALIRAAWCIKDKSLNIFLHY